MNAKKSLARRRLNGFTLIELMIAVAVVGILLAVALPSFLDSIRKGRRAEAFAALSAIQQAQERWRSNRPAYTGTVLDLIPSATSTPGGYYTMTVTLTTGTEPTSYVATADGSGSTQANDGQCAKLGVKVDKGAITYASCRSCSSFTYAATDRCWSR